MGTFLHMTHCVSSGDMTKIGLMILLAHLKFCWRSFEVKVAPENNLRQQNFAGATPENTDTGDVAFYLEEP
jgi:hypothetical protein